MKNATSLSSTMQPLAQELAQWSSQQVGVCGCVQDVCVFDFPLTPSQAVNMVAAHSAVSYLVPGGQLMTSRGPSEGLGSTLSPKLRELLFRHQASIAEQLPGPVSPHRGLPC